MKWLNKAAHAGITLVLFAFGACTKEAAPTSPEAALERYVKTAFGAKSVDAKKSLLDLSEGDAKAWLESMTDEVFKKQFVENNMQFVSLKSSDKRVEKDGDVSLVYELAFKDGKTPNAAEYTNKKIAYLKKTEGGEWKVSATKNIKTFIEKKDALEVPPLSMLPPSDGAVEAGK
jgi:hypothetical protein